MKPKFKIGQKVKVTKDGRNASNFTSKLNLPIRGIYENKNWLIQEYTILSNGLETNFEFEELSKYAYALGIDNVIVGFVYENGIEIISYKEETLKIPKSVLLQLAENNSFSEEIIKKEFPQLFESELEECRWVKDKYLDKFLCYFDSNGNRYGFDLNGDWFTDKSNLKPSSDNRNVYATEQEVFEALKNEAVKRGFVKGATFKSIRGNKEIKIVNEMYSYNLKDNAFFANDYYGVIFEDGKWAKIIDQPKEITISERLERIEKHLGIIKE